MMMKSLQIAESEDHDSEQHVGVGADAGIMNSTLNSEQLRRATESAGRVEAPTISPASPGPTPILGQHHGAADGQQFNPP